jgi:hypothetical protein
MKNIILSLLLLSLFCGCINRHVRTTQICDTKLYKETFTSLVEVHNAYITDSLNFRMYIGRYDGEHENYNCTCEGDSLILKKLKSNEFTGLREVVSTQVYSLSELKRKRIFD